MQGSTYLFELLLWKVILSQSYNLTLAELGWKHVARQIFPTYSTIYFSLVSQNQPAFACWNSAIKTVEESAKYFQG